MIQKCPIYPERIRKIQGSFTFIEHRFLRDGFFANLTQQERSLYMFLALASDRKGMSYFSYDKICAINGMILRDYIQARDGLIDKDLIAFDGTLFQVLSLPEKPRLLPKKKKERDPAAICKKLAESFGRIP